MMMDFRTIMISDANAARSNEEHLATLITFVQAFGDVRSSDDVIALLESNAGEARAAKPRCSISS
jgi:ureidoacrylate peracid hydrolase